MAQPQFFNIPLGQNADVNTIPQTSTEGAGNASFTSLFPQETQTPLESGGICPTRQDFNGLFKLLGDHLWWIQHGGQYAYNSSYAYEVGNIVLFDNLLYKCIQACANIAPTNASYWTQIAGASSDYVTLATEQYIAGLKHFNNNVEITNGNGIKFNGSTGNSYTTLKWGTSTEYSYNEVAVPTKSGTLALVEDLASVSGVPVGTVIWIARISNQIPDGYLYCNGSNVSRTEYADLFRVLSTRYNNSSTTSDQFGLPDLTGRYLRGAESLGAIGSTHDEALPNISGAFTKGKGSPYPEEDGSYTQAIATGAFTAETGSLMATEAHYSSLPTASFTFDASKSSSIYGNYTSGEAQHVYPSTMNLLPLIKY